jgi:hypothetical protein
MSQIGKILPTDGPLRVNSGNAEYSKIQAMPGRSS